jgi:hypothetical protein
MNKPELLIQHLVHLSDGPVVELHFEFIKK